MHVLDILFWTFIVGQLLYIFVQLHALYGVRKGQAKVMQIGPSPFGIMCLVFGTAALLGAGIALADGEKLSGAEMWPIIAGVSLIFRYFTFRLTFSKNGLLYRDHFIPWKKVSLFAWSGKNSTLHLTIARKGTWKFLYPAQLTMDIPASAHAAIKSYLHSSSHRPSFRSN